MSLFDRLLEQQLRPRPPAAARDTPPTTAPAAVPSAPPPAPTTVGGRVSRGSCKAINPDTGRQCALLAGHTKPHRHGNTEFLRAAAPDQKYFTRRDALDRQASSRSGSVFTTPATGE